MTQWELALQAGNVGAAVAAGDPGTMMMGFKLQGAERLRAWGAVALFTLLAILQNMGNFMPAYLYEKVRTCTSQAATGHLLAVDTTGSS